MLKKAIALSVMMIVASSLSLFAQGSFDEELAALEKQQASLNVQIEQVKGEVKQATQEYKEADMALRQELIIKEKDLKETQDPKTAHVIVVREGKERQAQLRKTYYDKKKPLAKKLYSLKDQAAEVKRKVKKLQHKKDRLAEGKFANLDYEEKLEDLKAQIKALDNKYLMQKADLKSEFNEKVDALSEQIGEKRARKRLAQEYASKKADLRATFLEKKVPLSDQYEALKKEYRQWQKTRSQEWNTKKKGQQVKAKKKKVKTKSGETE